MEEGFNKLNKRSLADLMNFFKWLWADAFVRYKKDVIVSTISSIVRIITQFGALALIYTYASGLESHRTFNVLDFQFDARTSGILLIIVSVVGLIIYTISAFSDYISKSTSISLWQNYELYSLKRFTLLKSRIPHPLCSKANEMLSGESVSRDGRTESKYLGRLFSQLLNSIIPVTTLLIVTAVLFYISYKFTFIVLILSAISMFFLYKFSMQILQNMDNMKTYSKTYLPEKTKLLNRINRVVSPITENEHFFKNMFSQGETRKFQDAFFVSFLLREKSSLIVNILTGLSIITIIAISGFGIIYGSFNWAIFLAYIVSLQYFLGSLMQIGNSLSMFSRFYPEAKRYYEFVCDAEKSNFDTKNIELDTSSVYLKITDLDKKNEFAELKSGKITYLYNPKGVNRNLASILNNNTVSNNGNSERYFYWFMNDTDFSGMTIRQSYGFSDEYDEDSLEYDLGKILDDKNGIKLKELKLDHSMSVRDFADLPENVKSGLQILSAIHSNCKILFFNEKDFRNIQKIINQNIKSILNNRIIIVVTHQTKPLKLKDEHSIYLISSLNKLVSWWKTEWIADNPEKFDRYLKYISIQNALEESNSLENEHESEE